MSEHRDPVLDALRQLRGEVRDAVTPPPAAGLRARAIRQLRVRRATAVAVAAAVVAVIALGGATLLGSNAAPPAPPAGSPTPSSPDRRPSPTASLDDPITEVDWSTATIDIPPREGCPDGPIEFAPDPDYGPDLVRGPRDELPAMAFDTTVAAYGDLNGDGRAETVFEASCAPSEEGMNSGHGGQLLVVASGDDGTLTGLGWAGPPGALFLDWWVADGRLLIDADPWTVNAEDHFVATPGLALAYQWDGDGFAGWEPASEYPPILPTDPDELGPPVRMGPVATALGCPDVEIRFPGDPEAPPVPGTDRTYWWLTAQPQQQSLFDLDRTGERLLVIYLECEDRKEDGTDDDGSHGLAVFERAGAGWQGVSLLLPEDGWRGWSWVMEGDQLLVEWLGQGEDKTIAYRWNGTEFIEE